MDNEKFGKFIKKLRKEKGITQKELGEKLNITGVLDVLSFDDQIVILETELGLLTVKGENLRINKLCLDTSEVTIDGAIYQLAYSEKDSMEKSGGILGKIFK